MWFLVREIALNNYFWRLRCELVVSLHHKEICDKIQVHPLVDSVDWRSIYDTITVNSRDMSERDTLFCMDCGILAPSEHNKYGLTLLKQACRLGYNQVASRCLLEEKIDLTSEVPSCLNIACWSQQVETVKLLLADTRMDPSVGDSRSFILAATRGHPEVVEVLMRDGRCDINIQQGWVPECEKTPVDEAKYLEVARLLLSDPRFDPAMYDSWYLISACIIGHTSVVEVLLKDGRADPTVLNYQAVHEAWNREHKEILDMLLADQRVDLRTRIKYNRTTPILCCLGSILLGAAIGAAIGLAAFHAVRYIDREYYRGR
ncbi:Hypothetical protein POVR2_LOCUS395 [uncultured virus]|nr:Hypothetical protein POVR2_LOCUS395 [uncultured virus]